MARNAASCSLALSLGLQLCLCCHQWLLHGVVLLSAVLLVYQGVLLPRLPASAAATEALLLVLYSVLERARLFQASKGNKTRQRTPLLLSVALTAPTLLYSVYSLPLQPYALRLHVVAMALSCAEAALAVAALLRLCASTSSRG